MKSRTFIVTISINISNVAIVTVIGYLSSFMIIKSITNFIIPILIIMNNVIRNILIFDVREKQRSSNIIMTKKKKEEGY